MRRFRPRWLTITWLAASWASWTVVVTSASGPPVASTSSIFELLPYFVIIVVGLLLCHWSPRSRTACVNVATTLSSAIFGVVAVLLFPYGLLLVPTFGLLLLSCVSERWSRGKRRRALLARGRARRAKAAGNVDDKLRSAAH